MRKYRFFLRHTDPSAFLPEKPFLLTEKTEPEIFGQLSKVLRVREGDEVTLLLPGLPEHDYRVEQIEKRTIHLEFQQQRVNENELKRRVTLTLSLPNKPEKLEFIVQKAVELGVSHIDLVKADYSQFKHGLRPDRLQKIIVEAAEQSERGVIPTFSERGMLVSYLNASSPTTLQTFAVALERSEKESGIKNESPLSEAVAKNPESINLLIGPEGGFSENEKRRIHELNLFCFSLGPRILRMETAAIVAVGLASVRW